MRYAYIQKSEITTENYTQCILKKTYVPFDVLPKLDVI